MMVQMSTAVMMTNSRCEQRFLFAVVVVSFNLAFCCQSQWLREYKNLFSVWLFCALRFFTRPYLIHIRFG